MQLREQPVWRRPSIRDDWKLSDPRDSVLANTVIAPALCLANPPKTLIQAAMDDPTRSQRRAEGLAMLEALHPQAAVGLKQSLEDIAPDLMDYVAEFPFGDLYQRGGIETKLRQTATLASLATLGQIAQLRIHIGIARKMGFSRTEVIEIFIQLAAYAGFPVAINAILAAKDVFAAEESETD